MTADGGPPDVSWRRSELSKRVQIAELAVWSG
jgi:hypothetical protein